MAGMRYVDGSEATGNPGVWLIDGEVSSYIVSAARPAEEIDAHLRTAIIDGRPRADLDALLDARIVLVV